MYVRDTLLKDLKVNVASVLFTKANGEDREMRCTLMPRFLPQNTDVNFLEEEHKKTENLEVVVCWDVMNGGWRSFRIDSVKSVQLLDATQY